MRKLMLNLITPPQLGEKAADLWRRDHTHGDLRFTKTNDRSFQLALWDHPYTARPISQMAVAEIYRYACSLTRCASVDESHVMQGTRALVVNLHWR